MALAGIAFIGHGIVFLVSDFVESGFELGVSPPSGMTSTDLDPTVAYSISHLHVATAAFISTGRSHRSLVVWGAPTTHVGVGDRSRGCRGRGSTCVTDALHR